MLVLESGVEIPFGSLVRLKSDPQFPQWDSDYGGKLALLIGEQWSRELQNYLYIILVEGKLIYCEEGDFYEDHSPPS